MPRTRHIIPKLDLLVYALEGARTRRGVWMGAMDDEEAEQVDNDIAEIERRIKLVELANKRKTDDDYYQDH